MQAPPNIACPCCGQEKYKLVYSGITSIYSDRPCELFRCLECGNVITWPLIAAHELEQIYTLTYLYPVHHLARGEKKFRAKELAKFVRREFSPSKSTSVLEIGCMYGDLLLELNADYAVRGIDIGKDAVAFCKQKGLDVDLIPIETFLEKNHPPFDLVILSHVLEHLLDPADTLKKIRSLLKPGGKVLILVPNQESFCRNVFGRYWGWWQVPVHINHFSRKAMRRLSGQTGFDFEAVRFRGGDSLMLLLNFVNLFGFRSKQSEPGFFQKFIIRIFTTIFRYWYFIGNEEMGVLLGSQKKDFSDGKGTPC